ncbi:hypothetical protein X975_05691, partial [Stegodyphus mimosarum]
MLLLHMVNILVFRDEAEKFITHANHPLGLVSVQAPSVAVNYTIFWQSVHSHFLTSQSIAFPQSLHTYHVHLKYMPFLPTFLASSEL